MLLAARLTGAEHAAGVVKTMESYALTSTPHSLKI